MNEETFEVPESVAELSIDVAECADSDSSTCRDELDSRIDELIEQLLGDPNLEMPASMVEALELGWKIKLA